LGELGEKGGWFAIARADDECCRGEFGDLDFKEGREKETGIAGMAPKKGVNKDERPAIESNPWKLAGIGDTAGLKALVEHPKDPIDVNAPDAYGCQPIVWASRNGYVETMNYILEQGGDIESSGFGGMRPLHHACNQLRDGVLSRLLELGADVNAADDNGNVALHFASERGVLEPIEAIIKAGGNVNSANTNKATPLMKAANDGHISVVQKLVKCGADINAQDAKGNSALHIAAANQFKQMVRWMLENGANPKLKNKSSKTPAAVAGPLASLFETDAAQEE
ncbi:Kinase D-interacting substrate of 220 kDa B (Ankyrin repeat-rich membrane-spanning protein B), partial [Durusdinium trenchii]